MAWPPSCVAEALAFFGAGFALVAKLDLAAHARARGDGEGACLDVAIDDARLEELDPLGILDVAEELAPDAHDARLDVPFEARPGIEAQVPVDLHIALEAAGDAHVARADDLALDGEVRGEEGFLPFLAWRGTPRHIRAQGRYVRPFGLPRRRAARHARAGGCGTGSRSRLFPKRHEDAPLSD